MSRRADYQDLPEIAWNSFDTQLVGSTHCVNHADYITREAPGWAEGPLSPASNLL